MVSVDVKHHVYLLTYIGDQSSGAVRESRWPSWAFRPNEPYGFRGRKDLLNHAHACLSLSLVCQPTSEDIKQQTEPKGLSALTTCSSHRWDLVSSFYLFFSYRRKLGHNNLTTLSWPVWMSSLIIIIIIDNFCIALFSGVPKLTALYILQHFLSFTNIIHIIMTTNNV